MKQSKPNFIKDYFEWLKSKRHIFDEFSFPNWIFVASLSWYFGGRHLLDFVFNFLVGSFTFYSIEHLVKK